MYYRKDHSCFLCEDQHPLHSITGRIALARNSLWCHSHEGSSEVFERRPRSIQLTRFYLSAFSISRPTRTTKAVHGRVNVLPVIRRMHMKPPRVSSTAASRSGDTARGGDTHNGSTATDRWRYRPVNGGRRENVSCRNGSHLSDSLITNKCLPCHYERIRRNTQWPQSFDLTHVLAWIGLFRLSNSDAIGTSDSTTTWTICL